MLRGHVKTQHLARAKEPVLSQNVALRVRFGILGANDAALDQPSDIRMIAREARNGLGANQVEATVADMGEAELTVDDGESGTGRSHAVELGMLHRETLNVPVSGFEGPGQGILRIATETSSVDAAHSLDGKATGLLSTFVPTHAIGHDGETALAEEILPRNQAPSRDTNLHYWRAGGRRRSGSPFRCRALAFSSQRPYMSERAVGDGTAT